MNQETQEKKEDKMICVLDEDSMKSWVDFWSKESDNEVGQRMENWMSVLQGVKEVDVERVWTFEMGGMKQGESNGGSKSKSNGDRTSKNKGSSGRQSKGKTQDRSKVSKASKYVSTKKNS